MIDFGLFISCLVAYAWLANRHDWKEEDKEHRLTDWVSRQIQTRRRLTTRRMHKGRRFNNSYSKKG